MNEGIKRDFGFPTNLELDDLAKTAYNQALKDLSKKVKWKVEIESTSFEDLEIIEVIIDSAVQELMKKG